MVATKSKLKKIELIQTVACCVILHTNNLAYRLDVRKELKLLDLTTSRRMHMNCHKNVHTVAVTKPFNFFFPLPVGGRRITRHDNAKNVKVPEIADFYA